MFTLKDNSSLLLVLIFGFTVAIQHTAYTTSPLPPSPPVCEFTGEVTNLLDKYENPTKISEEVNHLEIKIKSVGKQLQAGSEFFKDIFRGCQFFNLKSIKAFIATDRDRIIKFKIGNQISGKLSAEGYNENTFLTLNGVYDLTILSSQNYDNQNINNVKLPLTTSNDQPHDNLSVNNIKLQWWNPISWVRVLWAKLFR